MTLTRFDAFNGQTYTFPTAMGDQDFKTNFKELMTKTTHLPGSSGGISEYGIGKAPSPVGVIQVGIILDSSETPSGMTALRDALNKMTDWGMGKLVDNLNGSERFAVCSVKSVGMAEQRQKHTDMFQPIPLTFEAPEPFWLTKGNQELWDGSRNWDSSINWDNGSFTTVTGSGTLTVTPSGSAYTHGRFVARVTGAQNFTQLRIQRLLNGRVADELFYQGPLVQNDVIEMDPRRHWCLLNGVDVLANLTYRYADWLRLLPTTNTINVTLDDVAAAISANIFYYDRYS